MFGLIDGHLSQRRVIACKLQLVSPLAEAPAFVLALFDGLHTIAPTKALTATEEIRNAITEASSHIADESNPAALVLKISPVTARKTLSNLVRLGFLMSDSPKTPVRLAFQLHYRERLFPNLFTDPPVA
jgi:hypothetical protein